MTAKKGQKYVKKGLFFNLYDFVTYLLMGADSSSDDFRFFSFLRAPRLLLLGLTLLFDEVEGAVADVVDVIMTGGVVAMTGLTSVGTSGSSWSTSAITGAPVASFDSSQTTSTSSSPSSLTSTDN